MIGRVGAGLAITLAIVVASAWWHWGRVAPWTAAELETLQTLWLENLPLLQSDPTNQVAQDPRAQELGHRLFFDTRLSTGGKVSCATCHQPAFRFTDQMPVSQGLGATKRNAPSLVGVAYSPWFYWDGRKDSLWSQALAPLEAANEHGGNRTELVRLIGADQDYLGLYEAIFSQFPDLSDLRRFPLAAGPVEDPAWSAAWQNMTAEDRNVVNQVFANIGKSIAAYESLLVPGYSRFDLYVQTLVDKNASNAMVGFSDAERRGLRLFIGAGQCTQCHNGPLFTNNAFHNTGVLSRSGATPDVGRVVGLREALADPFNCAGPYSDEPTQCLELRFANTGSELIGAVRTPSLRNLAGTHPYAHAGQFATVAGVLRHYDQAPEAMIGHNEAKPLGFWPWQLADLEAFLGSLNAVPDVPEKWLRAP